MASSTWPDGSPRTVDDNEYEILGMAWSMDGIVGSPADTAVVYGDSSGMQVKIRSGKYGVVHGKGWHSGSSDITKSIAANGTGQPRIDLVVLGLDRATQLVTEYVKTGTAATLPVAPAMQRDPAGPGSGKWEIPLATVAVAAGAATITAGNVTPIAAWIGAGSWNVPDVDTLNRISAISSPPSGTTAIVGTGMYVYTPSTNWRRVDWNASWGVIGGKEYTGNGAVTAAGITVGAGEVLANLDTGAVTVMSGRRYQVRANFQFVNNTSGTICSFAIRENSVSGSYRAALSRGPVAGSVSYYDRVVGGWSETAGSTRTFVLSASTTGGSMSIARSALFTAPTCVEIVDQGPTGTLTAI